MSGEPPSSGNQVIDRAVRLLHAVVAADEPLSFTELADDSGLARSTTSRLLTALERADLLARDGDGGYVAGRLFWRYAARHDPWQEVARIAEPELEALRDVTGETVVLAAVRGDGVQHVAQVDSHHFVGTRDWTAVEVPSHVSALGKVLLAYGAQPPLTDLPRLTDRSVTDPGELERHLADVRRQGFAAAVDELELGLTGVAVPLRVPDAYRGSVTAAVGVSGPTARLDGRIPDLARALTEGADRLTQQLAARRPGKRGAA